MESSYFPQLAVYPVSIRLPVQWGDQDAFGHVNNATYFRWFESARIAYLEKLGLADKNSQGSLGPILAAVSCNYRRQVKFPDTAHVGVRVSRLGRSSMSMQYLLVSEAQQATAADGDSTIVVFDYAAQRPQPMPDALRERIIALEATVGADLRS